MDQMIWINRKLMVVPEWRQKTLMRIVWEEPYSFGGEDKS